MKAPSKEAPEAETRAYTPIYCPRCKASNLPGAEFCRKCGAVLHEKRVISQPSRRADLLLSWLPALFLCGLILIHLVSWPPQLEEIGQLAVLGWMGVALLTVACARVLRLLGGSPESIQSLGGVSLTCSLSLLCLWVMLGTYIGVEPFYLISYTLLLSAGCALLAFWPKKPRKPERAVEPPLPPVPVGPAELEKIQKKLLAYIKEHQGVVERKKCLLELGLTDNLFVVAVRGLEKTGKLRLKEGILF
jgi:ribosomal protein L40E